MAIISIIKAAITYLFFYKIYYIFIEIVLIPLNNTHNTILQNKNYKSTHNDLLICCLILFFTSIHDIGVKLLLSTPTSY